MTKKKVEKKTEVKSTKTRYQLINSDIGFFMCVDNMTAHRIQDYRIVKDKGNIVLCFTACDFDCMYAIEIPSDKPAADFRLIDFVGLYASIRDNGRYGFKAVPRYVLVEDPDTF